MAQEEKAKRYDLAIEVAKKYHNGTLKDVMETIFPELAESEDKRIRKAIINIIGDIDGGFQFEKYGILKKDALTWLEAQGEQKPADNVEPKFEIDDWVVWDNKISCHIDNIYQGKNYLMYTITDTNNMTRSYSVKGFDSNAHLWTIQDTKDGDVLVGGEQLFLFKRMNTSNSFYAHCSYHFIGYDSLSIYCSYSIDNIHPATKEQRDLLFQKIKEAGYEWDTKKKELKKIVAPIFHIGDRVRYKEHACDGVITEITDTDYICGDAKLPISTQDKLELIEQNSAWSEEDEKLLGLSISNLAELKDRFGKEYGRTGDCIEWLKSLKDRYTWKPSELQIEALDSATENCAYSEYQNCLRELIGQLKKLREK